MRMRVIVEHETPTYDAVGSVWLVPIVGSKIVQLVDDVLERDIDECRRRKGTRREAAW